ncbi:MAG: thrombospondin type 3 repeat-containing protein [Nitrosopumilus sp.]|nr:thrombospondin type 3 repeat-containing protein [Nitrosopumilus sp.]NRA04912.1 thrombospondin type 3 repeat-containing protein [Nitrosopumilus sp.]
MKNAVKALTVVVPFLILSVLGFGLLFFNDADADGVINSFDNCPNIVNPTQSDFDSDKIGDDCDIDDDNDGVVDAIDAFDTDPSEWSDFDSDKIGDNADIDDDNDGVVDAIDAFDTDPSEWSDFDFDGIGANQDPDDDNDGILDLVDKTPILPTEQLAIEYLEEIQNCSLEGTEKLSTTCYSQLFQKIIAQEESTLHPIDLSITLSKLGAIDDCHFTTHAMAHASFNENPNIIETLSGLDGSLCRGAFYHGSIASYFDMLKDEGKFNLTSHIELCDSFSGTSNYQDCVHGLGHGFVLFYFDELMPSVNSCNQMSFYQNQICIKGVMMQYTTDKMNQYGITSENISNMCPNSELSSQDYQQCVMSIGTTFAFQNFHNFDEASKFCELMDDEKDQNMCIQGLELEIQDSEKYKVSPLTQDIREKFQPQSIEGTSKIIDIRSPAIISNFEFIPKVGIISFSIDRPQYVILYIPNEFVTSKMIVTVNGQLPSESYGENNIFGEEIAMIRFIPKDAGFVMVTPLP